jgi:hypothetical protein
VHVILEYPATPAQTRGIQLAFARAGINAKLRAAPRRREFESPVWRVVVSAPLHELLVGMGVPRFGMARSLRDLVLALDAAWGLDRHGHMEVGPRGVNRRATGGVLLTPNLPDEAYNRLVQLAATTLDPERLLLWDRELGEWSTFDSGVPEPARSAVKSGANVGGEGVQRRFRRVD